MKCAMALLLGVSMLFALASCAPANETQQNTAQPTAEPAPTADSPAQPDGMGSVASCGTHNGQPFYIGYQDDFGDALAALTAIDFSEDADAGAKRIAVHVPGGSTRVALVNITHDASDDSFFPMSNVGWAALTKDEYITYAAAIPEDIPDLAVVVYSDDWETQQAFALRHDAANGLELTPVTLDE